VQSENGQSIVTSFLTVNIIPQGLGDIHAPRVTLPDPSPSAPLDPQTLNRYSYVFNNPLKYVDSTGYFGLGLLALAKIIVAIAGWVGLISVPIGCTYIIVEEIKSPTPPIHKPTTPPQEPALPVVTDRVTPLHDPSISITSGGTVELPEDQHEPGVEISPVVPEPVPDADITHVDNYLALLYYYTFGY